MKRAYVFLLLAIFVYCNSFADSTSRFYKNHELLDTMYVNSLNGLKIRDNVGLKANRIAVVPYRIPLKIIKLGEIATIDGISAPWVKVLVPRYLWKTSGTHYGWVFGGYLEENCPVFLTKGWTSKDLAEYLERNYWREYKNDTDFNYAFIFNKDGSFWRGKLGSGIGEGGTWNVVSNNTVEFHTKSVMESEEDSYWSFELEFYPNGSFSSNNIYFYNDFACLGDTNLQESSGYYGVTKNDDNFIKWVINTKWIRDKDELIREAIEAGISAEGTEYEELYHQYWKDRENPSWN